MKTASVVKICGIKDPENLRELISFEPNYLGFIFYRKSKRYMAETLLPQHLNEVPKSIAKVGVFVDESIEKMLSTAATYNLQVIQLHGSEGPEICQKLKEQGLQVFKAIAVDSETNFNDFQTFSPYTDAFILDTKGPEKGGNGYSFSWEILNSYTLEVPFLLSGGIGNHNLKEAETLSQPFKIGYDINSKMETEPGLKCPQLVKQFFKTLQHANN
ncbi:MAG: phosphoribosylanthranilate isomerase [Luteibaculaceae bacterium]